MRCQTIRASVQSAAMDQPSARLVDAAGAAFCVYDWPGANPLPPVVFCHATSFHARVWDETIRALRELQPGRRCLALDTRGHGRSVKAGPPNPWPQAGRDLVEVMQALGLSDVLGVGHSFGGHALIRGAAAAPGLFNALVLIDPTVFPRAVYANWRMPEAMIAVTRKRRNQWASADEMFERFSSRSPFSRWRPAVLRDYCDYGVEPDGAGGYRLACSPETEAGIYATSSLPENGLVYADLAGLEIPARVVRCGIARHGAEGAEMMLSSPTAPDLVTHFRHAEDVVLADTSHFIPMEAPERVAALIASWPPA